MANDAALAASELAAAATHLRYRRALASLGDDIHRVEFWRELNPALRVSDTPFDDGTVATAELGSAELEQLRVEGYVRAPALPADDVAQLRMGIERLVAAGLPAAFVFVYDETYAAFASVARSLGAVLGPRAWALTRECWAFHVAPGDPALTRWSAFSPHRDWLGGDPGVLRHDLPTVLSVWIPLVDVSTLDSCMYVLPANCDGGYYAPEYMYDSDTIRLQDIRALPVSAGSVLAWSTHLLHWGSRSSRFAATPRMSVTCDVQRRDAPPCGPVIELDRAPAFADRLALILRAVSTQVPSVSTVSTVSGEIS